jgi:hypothetical protein
MTLQKLKEKFDSIYGFDLADRSRKREMVDARRVYCKIAFSLKYNLRQIGESIDRKHCNIIHLLDTVDQATDFHKNVHDSIVKEYGFLTGAFNIDKAKAFEAKLLKEKGQKTASLIKEINNTLINWDIDSLNNFLQTRVKPYNKLIETTKPQKKVEEVKGAKLNRPVKNPLLM